MELLDPRSKNEFIQTNTTVLNDKHQRERGVRLPKSQLGDKITEKSEDDVMFDIVTDADGGGYIHTSPPQLLDAHLTHLHFEPLNFLRHLHERKMSGVLADPFVFNSSPLAVAAFFCWLRSQGVEGPYLIITNEDDAQSKERATMLKKNLENISGT